MIEEYTLKCVEGARKGVSRTFPGCGNVNIGRKRDCDLPVPDMTVSANHCTLIADGQVLWLRDNGSANGTVVGGELVREVALRDGDVITLGGRCRFQLSIQYGISQETETIIRDITKAIQLGFDEETEPNYGEKTERL